jgi:hypothetical protein
MGRLQGLAGGVAVPQSENLFVGSMSWLVQYRLQLSVEL